MTSAIPWRRRLCCKLEKNLPISSTISFGTQLRGTSQDRKCSHWYIVYHPDTIWYASFNNRIVDEPLGERFCGYTNCLDMAVIFMQAIRKRKERKRRSPRQHGQSTRTIKLHLLIPAYRPLLIPEFVKFPEDLSYFVVEGDMHDSKHLVSLNIPEEQNHFLFRIENWKPREASLVEQIGAFVGFVTLPPENTECRVLGTRAKEDEDNDDSSIASLTLSVSSRNDSDDILSDDNFLDNDNESHTGRRPSSTNHSAEPSGHDRRGYQRTTGTRRRRHYKSKEIGNTHKPGKKYRGL